MTFIDGGHQYVTIPLSISSTAAAAAAAASAAAISGNNITGGGNNSNCTSGLVKSTVKGSSAYNSNGRESLPKEIVIKKENVE